MDGEYDSVLRKLKPGLITANQWSFVCTIKFKKKKKKPYIRDCVRFSEEQRIYQPELIRSS